MEFKLAEWIRKFHHMKLMVPFTTNLKLTMDLTDFQYQVLFFIHTVGSRGAQSKVRVYTMRVPKFSEKGLKFTLFLGHRFL